jgi:chitinase
MVHGICEHLLELKEKNRHLKVVLSIGGGSGSGVFSPVMNSIEHRNRLVSTCSNFVETYGFDGIDIDWEYPTTTADGENFTTFIRELRCSLDTLAQKMSTEPFLITIAINCSTRMIKTTNVGEFHSCIDFVNVMGYDFHGPWTKLSGHQSSLYHPSKGKSIDQAITCLDALGVPMNKIVLGVPFYGRAFCNTEGIGNSHNGSIRGTWEDNVFDYNQLPLLGTVEICDAVYGASSCYDSNTNTIVTYDNPESIVMKVEYIKSKKLAGIMSWSINSDHKVGHERCLTDVIHRTIDDQVDLSMNHLEYPFSPFVNVRELGSEKNKEC